MKNLIYISIIALFFVSCEKDIKNNLKEMKEEITIKTEKNWKFLGSCIILENNERLNVTDYSHEFTFNNPYKTFKVERIRYTMPDSNSNVYKQTIQTDWINNNVNINKTIIIKENMYVIIADIELCQQ